VRISRDKVNKVAHVVADALAEVDAVDFVEDRNTIRLEIRKILEDLLNQEAKIDQTARLKIESQKRTILEGSQECGNKAAAIGFAQIFKSYNQFAIQSKIITVAFVGTHRGTGQICWQI